MKILRGRRKLKEKCVNFGEINVKKVFVSLKVIAFRFSQCSFALDFSATKSIHIALEETDHLFDTSSITICLIYILKSMHFFKNIVSKMLLLTEKIQNEVLA